MQADILAISPFLCLAIGALIILIIDIFTENDIAKPLGVIFSTGALFFSVSMLCPSCYGGEFGLAFFDTVYVDKLSYLISALLSFGTLLTILFTSSSLADADIDTPTEYYSLILMSSAGALVFANAAELITLFLGLETMSMGLYCLCASAVNRKSSSESGLKYFLLGSFSSAFLLYGVVLIYGLTASTYYVQIAEVVTSVSGITEPGILAAGIGLIVLGVAFKIGLVPFHFWTPDVYQGAPTPITAYMAVVIKASAVIAGTRILFDVFPSQFEIWEPALWLISVITLVFANAVALRQRSLKRMLAYSSIGHAGYISMAFLAKDSGGFSAILYYLVAYTLMTVGAFAIVYAVTKEKKDANGSDDISTLNGFANKNPWLAACMTLFMLALAGLPPGMSGMIGKFYVFTSVIKANYIGLAVIGMLSATVACYYYLRVIVAMYFVKPEGDTAEITIPASLNFAILVSGILIVVFGICPSIVSIY